ncbi:MAG: hypothetical protein Kow0068_13640 [Marinilabiliales bacterium]
MKKLIFILLIANIFVINGLYAQYLYFRHNSYIPVSPFQTTFDNNTAYVLSAGSDIKSINLKAFKLFNDKYLIAWQGNAGFRNQYSTEIAFGKINMFGHNRFAILGGGGVGKTDNVTVWYDDVQLDISDKWESTYKYQYSVYTQYYKLFLQPSYGFNFYNTVYFSVDLKVNMNYYDSYYYDFIVDIEQETFYNEFLKPDNVYFHDKWGLNFEPSASVYTKRIDLINFFAQMGFSYSVPVINAENAHPMHKYMFVNAGVNFIFRNKD